MTRMICAALLTLACFGCMSQKLDQELMNVRGQVVENEKLYSMAVLKFADAFQQLSDQKHEFQEYLIEVEGDQWLAEHTQNGMVQASPEDFSAMLAKHDGRIQTLESSKRASARAVADFRQMVAEKLSFVTAIYGKEVDAQRAKESLAGTLDSAVKVLGGIAGAAAVAIPLTLP